MSLRRLDKQSSHLVAILVHLTLLNLHVNQGGFGSGKIVIAYFSMK